MDFTSSMLSAAAAAGYRRAEAAGLPKGWIREEIPRFANNFHNGSPAAAAPTFQNGTKPAVDVLYYSPRGHVVRSKPELVKAIGDQADMTAFDYQSGKFNPLLVRATAKPGPSVSGSAGRKSSKPVSTSAGLAAAAAAANSNSAANLAREAALVPPIRQTASIFKQPVTVWKNHEANGPESKEESRESKMAPAKARPDAKSSFPEKPGQVFWEKRLSGLVPSYPDEEFEPFKLPKNFLPIGPGVTDDIVLASISTSLHMGGGAINGQKDSKQMKESDASAFCIPDQPLIGTVKISQQDIEKQEDRVNDTRKKLADAISAMSG